MNAEGGNKSVICRMRRIIALSLGAVALVLCEIGLAASSGTTNSDNAYLTDLFAGRTVLHLQIDIPADGMRELSGRDSDSRRPSVVATVREGGHVYTNVAIHLKGG